MFLNRLNDVDQSFKRTRVANHLHDASVDFPVPASERVRIRRVQHRLLEYPASIAHPRRPALTQTCPVPL